MYLYVLIHIRGSKQKSIVPVLPPFTTYACEYTFQKGTYGGRSDSQTFRRQGRDLDSDAPRLLLYMKYAGPKKFFVLEYFIPSSEFFFQRDAINFGRSNNNGFSFNRHANGIYENASCAPPCRNSKGLDNRVQILVGCQPATMGKTGNLTLRKEVL